MHPDLLHHLSRTIAERRPTGMALALAAMGARTTRTPLDTSLIEPLADACALCLADVASRGEGELHLPLDGTTVLVLKIMSTQDAYTLELVPLGDSPHVRTAWLALYAPRLTITRVATSEEAVCAG